MDPLTKAKLFSEGGKLASDLLHVALNRPRKRSPEKAEEELAVSTLPTTPQYLKKPATTASIAPQSHPGVSLPTAEETAVELKRRLAKELYRAELDLAAGLKIANRPCDCLSNKHTLMLEAAAEELISQDPANAATYQDIVKWIPENAHKVTPAAIQSGQYTAEYPHMANEFKNFRKCVMGSAAFSDTGQPAPTITLEAAKKMAAEEAVKEVERAWKLEG